LIRWGERRPSRVVAMLRGVLAQEPLARVEYAEVLAADTLAPLKRLEGRVVLAVAARLGHTRFIDNILMRV